MKLALAMELPASTTVPVLEEDSLTLTPGTSEPIATDEQAAATEQPTLTEEALLTPEPSLTEVQPSPIVEWTSTEETVVTGEAVPSETEEPVVTEDPTIIIPAEGFWAASSPDGQVVTVVPKDWVFTNGIEFQIEFTEKTNEGMNVSGVISPDNKAFMYFMVYYDYDPAITDWNQFLAQERVLYILNKMHTNGVGDIQVTAIQSMLDGSERLSWSSQAGNCSGVIAYKAGPPIAGVVDHPKKLWLFHTLIVGSDNNNYTGIFNYAFELLTFPPEDSRIDV
jgi:hypothetical protein